MSNAPYSPHPRQGAAPVGGRPARRRWLLPLLLALLALIAVLLLLSRCGDNDDTTSTAATPTAATSVPSATATRAAASSPAPASGPAGDGSASAGPAGDPGTVTAGGADLLAGVSAAGLGAQDGRQAVGRAVRVQSVPADEGFWVGSGEQDRLWVQLTGTGGESAYKVKQGDTIDFTGTVTRAADGYAGEAGVTSAEGADQLTEQGHYVSAPSSSIKLSR